MASTFSETVTVPTLMISAVFIYSLIGNSGEVSFSPAAIVTLAVLVLVTSLSIFGFLRELSGHIGKAPGALMSLSTGEASTSLGTSGTGMVLPPSLQGKEWEESPKKKENQE